MGSKCQGNSIAESGSKWTSQDLIQQQQTANLKLVETESKEINVFGKKHKSSLLGFYNIRMSPRESSVASGIYGVIMKKVYKSSNRGQMPLSYLSDGTNKWFRKLILKWEIIMDLWLKLNQMQFQVPNKLGTYLPTFR